MMFEVETSLDLTFFGTGATQHVFTETSSPESGWLYKIPASFGKTVPFRPAFRSVLPWNRYLAAFQLLFFKVPAQFEDKVRARAGRSRNKSAANWQLIVGAASGGAKVLTACGDFLLGYYIRDGYARQFRRMIGLLQALQVIGLDDLLLPYRIINHSRATLRVGEKIHSYQGPILVQRRAHRFIDRPEGIEAFDWRQLVTAQHRLWRHGIAFSDASIALGPCNWAVYNGRILLGDTGSLTTDYRLAERTLAPELLSATENMLLQFADESERQRVAEYFALVRTEINETRLSQLWQSSMRPTESGFVDISG
jgi:hypothetical protein